MMRRAFLRARQSSLPRPTSQAFNFRGLATPSSPRHSPALAFAESPSSEHSSSHPVPALPPQPLSTLSSTSGQIAPLLHVHRNTPRTVLPHPIPRDVPSTETQSELYPSSALIDSLSLISVCLRRPETTPRAYDIFYRLVSEYEAGTLTRPDPSVWGEVIEGTIALAGQSASDAAADNWKRKAMQLVGIWEKNSPRAGYAYGIGHGGEKVYQGMLRGLLHSGLRTSSILASYVTHTKSLKLSDLVPAFSVSELPLVLKRLKADAEESNFPELLSLLEEEERIQADARVRMIEQAKALPVPELRITKERKVGADLDEAFESLDAASELPTSWSIANLRNTLRAIDASELPIARQERLERASLESARALLEHETEHRDANGISNDGTKLADKQLQAMMWEWLQALTRRLDEVIGEMNEKARIREETPVESRKRMTAAMKLEADLLLYLNLLEPGKLALITILETMRLAGVGGIADGMKMTRAIVSVGVGVEAEYRVMSLKDIVGTTSDSWLRTLDKSTHKPERKKLRNVWKTLGKELEKPEQSEDKVDDEKSMHLLKDSTEYEQMREVWTPGWPQSTHVSIGGFLVHHLIETAQVTRNIGMDDGSVHTEQQAAFIHAYEYVKGRKLGIIQLNPVVSSRVAKDSVRIVVHPRHLPMLVPPKPWTGVEEGGYLHHKVSAMRVKDSLEQRTYMHAAADSKRLDTVFAGLDVLSSTRWAINKKIFRVLSKVWNSGEAFGDIPAAEDKAVYNRPERPDSKNSNPAERAQYALESKELHRQMQKDHAERCKYNYNLELARSYHNDIFYIPHNLDFRGRAYPIPPHLSPVGDDITRSLLLFGDSKPLGERGLMWLRIHIANLYGYDKVSFADRVQFSIEHEADIIESAETPLEGKMWWRKAEEPWQCLAACNELASALKLPDPTKYLSNLPIHQDGTCNGMQHYAALGGDSGGARAVNLIAGDKPADVYTNVADLVNEIVDRDAADGHILAKLVKGKISRKVVKQTVMTTVYGVTFIGAKAQIAKQLMAKGGLPKESVYYASGYVAKTVLNCITDLFGGAKAIQDWLSFAARLISRSIPIERVDHAVQLKGIQKGLSATEKERRAGELRMTRELMSSVIWTTPLNLPVVQPYRKAVKKQVMATLQSVYISDPNALAEVASAKQATAFPPNFVHSLDATHMLLTAIKARQSGLAFASVHDSYWSHACSIDDLSTAIRDTFIQLHSVDLIGDLRAEFVERYAGHMIPVKLLDNILRNHNRPDRKQKNLMKAEEEDGSEGEEEVENAEEVEEVEGVEGDEELKGGNTKKVLRDLGVSPQKYGEETRGFVKLIDILPPAPKRGEFDVETIRLSPYFFS